MLLTVDYIILIFFVYKKLELAIKHVPFVIYLNISDISSIYMHNSLFWITILNHDIRVCLFFEFFT